jgi:hypothetical protein
MNRILIALSAFLLLAAPLHARMFVDLYGGANDAGDAGILLGGGISAGWDLSHGLAFLVRPEYYGATEDGGKPAETVRALGMLTAGLQYARQLGERPLFWTASAGMGGACFYEQGPKRFGPFIDPSRTETVYDFGPSLTVRAGMLYYLTQWLGIFLEAGYAHSFFFDEFSDQNTGGFQAMTGMRFTLSGKNSDMGEGW